MNEYHKINTVFKRDMSRNGKTLLDGRWTKNEFQYLAGNLWTYTEKVDGTNIRVMLENGVIKFGGKTDNAQIPAQLMTRLNALFLPLVGQMQEIFPAGVCLYGEGYGAKIQKVGEKYLPFQDFVLFDVKSSSFWLQRSDVEDIAQKLGLSVVPIVGEGTLYQAIDWVRNGFPSTWGDFIAEGIVARPQVELKTRDGVRIITKIKHRDFKNEL